MEQKFHFLPNNLDQLKFILHILNTVLTDIILVCVIGKSLQL